MRIEIAQGKYAKQIADIYATLVRSTAISFETEELEPEDMEKRIESISQRYPFLICRDGKRVTGFVYADCFGMGSGFEWTATSRIFVHQGYQRKGIAEALYTSLLDILRQQGVSKVYATVGLPNLAGCALHEKMGFEKECVFKKSAYKHGTWHDILCYSIELNNDLAPRKLVSFNSIDAQRLEQALKAGEEKLCK